jgi:endonuclease G
MNDADPIYKGVRLPLAFWKILVYTKSDGSLVSAAYVLEQGQLIHNIPGLEAAFSPGTFRVTLSHLIERTGLDFNDLTANELPLSSGALEAGVQRVAILPSYSNVVL